MTSFPRSNDASIRSSTSAKAAASIGLSFALVAASYAQVQVQGQSSETAQTGSLTMAQAVEMARQRNGDVASAFFSYLQGKALAEQSRASFFPTLTPSYTYTTSRGTVVPGSNGFFSQSDVGAYALSLNWQVLDSGQRQFSYLSAKRTAESEFNNAWQVLRQDIFNVEDQFFLTLQATESLAQAQATFDNAKLIDDQTKFSAEVGKTAQKDTFQSAADLANARVTLIQARNATLTAGATLKATIGFPALDQLPKLETFPLPDTATRPHDLKTVMEQGIKSRPDLAALRKSVDSLSFAERLADVNAGLTYSLNTSFSETYAPNRYENRSIVLNFSYPLFDGGATRQAARAAHFAVVAAKYSLLQQERNARAQIETAFVNLAQIAEQIDAAKEAVIASTKNFEAATAAYKEGAESIIDVSTARVSLATAEANLISAKYSYYIADLNLQLATGAKMLGEPDPSQIGKGLSGSPKTAGR